MLEKLVSKSVRGAFTRRFRVRKRSDWYDKLGEFGTVEKMTVVRDNRKISCVKVASANSGKKKLAILAHPITRKGKFYFNEGGARLPLFLEMGYQVVLFDFNGFGESPPLDLFFWKDAHVVVAHFAESQEFDHMALYGGSMGAHSLVRSFPALPRGSSIVLENIHRSWVDICSSWKDNSFMVPLYRLVERLGFQEAIDMNIVEFLQGLKRDDLQFLLIAGEADTMTPAHKMEDVLASLPGGKKLVTIAGAQHMQGYETDSKLYETIIRDFLSLSG